MGAGHDHGHAHGAAADAAPRPPRTAGGCASRCRITLTVMVVEIVGGLLADSLALIADAAHMATDARGPRHGAARDPLREPPADRQPHLRLRPRRDPRRARQLSAAARRRRLSAVRGGRSASSPGRDRGRADDRRSAPIGLVANMVSLSLLMRGQKESLNVRGAFLEVLADALGSLAVLVSAGDHPARPAGRPPTRSPPWSSA